eukprot:7163135-Lingulodinium_polyedra.AAC.1
MASGWIGVAGQMGGVLGCSECGMFAGPSGMPSGCSTSFASKYSCSDCELVSDASRNRAGP